MVPCVGVQPFKAARPQVGLALPCRVRSPCAIVARPTQQLTGRGCMGTRALPVSMLEAASSTAMPAALPIAGPSLPLSHMVAMYELSEGLETPIQLIYLVTLLAFLAAGAFLVVRQVLIRRELDEAAKALGERIRTGEATCEDYFELGVILTRKRLFTQATKNLEKAKKVWDGEESELAQVHNALGYCYLNMEKLEESIVEFRRAVELQPGYVTAWNNLGDAYERTKNWRGALAAYQEALSYAPDNTIARQRSDFCKTRCERLGLN